MKVIFLDIDGVLNTKGPVLIDRKTVGFLKAIAEKTGAVIVLSSGWRYWFDGNMHPLTREARRLRDMLSESEMKLYGKTPDFSTEEILKNRTFSKVKAKEIKAWLEAHEDVESFIVLDDLDLNDDEINRRAIRINNMTGLTEDNADTAIGMLNY
jgi:hydroxymethylpyrimidine pyrophosphatase-like HAD family hydrolase